MNALALTDLHMLEDEPRIQDIRLGEMLGFERPRAIRQLIESNLEELETYGPSPRIMAMVEIGIGAKRPVAEYWLNEEQALLMSMFSRTKNAIEVRREIIRVYMDWRRGRSGHALIEDAVRVYREDLDVQALAATLLPFWNGGARPKFWPDLPVRQYLLEMHRQTTVEKCRILCAEKFGAERTPGRTSLARFWKLLDRARVINAPACSAPSHGATNKRRERQIPLCGLESAR